MEFFYQNGMKYTYEDGVDDEGLPMRQNVQQVVNITVIDGIEYTVSNDAPTPVIYGVEVQALTVTEQAGSEAVYSSYNYLTDSYSEDVPVPTAWYVESTPYVPPAAAIAYLKARRLGTNNGKKFDMSWLDDDFKRNIIVPHNMTVVDDNE